MKQGKRNFGATDVLLLVLNAAFFIGIQSVFMPCEARPDGTWMHCHWAGQALTGVAAVLAVTALLHLVISRPQVKQGLSLAMIPLSVLAILLPGHLIELCMMETMRCHTVMKPAVTAISLLNILLAAVDVYIQGKRG
ncbi:hypothetical protein TAMA11512_22860 [Selenomonas sp. TAMA-11512]|uniref:DUF4418 family protein n=1 Tax=Selenomonas sp. TAMA-11512 TaxID=3095337 RepID=UPI003087D1A6|nr:hypothetical protein TAMA11512_22860 [Selenomonas sp. TAMA-11512]